MAIADRINEMYNHVGDAYDILELAGTNLSNLFNENVEQGAIGSYVGNTYENSKEDSATRIRTVNLIQLDKTKSYTISVKSGYSFAIFTFNDEKKYYDGGHAIWSSNEITITNIPYIALSFKKSSEANIVPSEIDDIQVMLNEGTIALPYVKSVDKNLINLAPTWKERLLYFINNGTDVVWNNWDKVTGEGTTLTLNNTEEAPMKINLKGNTSQATTTGKNLLPSNGTTGTINGVTFKKNADGSVLVNGTATSNTMYYLLLSSENISISAGNYYISGCPSNGSAGTYRLVIGVGDALYGEYGAGRAITISAGILTSYIYIAKGATVNNLLYKPMLTSGSTATEYEPYTNGASPNPDYPQDIHVVSGDNEIIVNSKNFLKLNDIAETTKNGMTYSCKDGVLTLNGTATSGITIDFDNVFLPAGTYYISRNSTGTTSGSWQNYLRNSSGNVRQGEGSFTTTEGQYVYFRLYMNSGVVFTNYTFKPMINLGSTATNYEPYQGNTYPINLPVENLVDLKSIGTRTSNGITITDNDNGTYTLNGTATANIVFSKNISTTLPIGTYTYAMNNSAVVGTNASSSVYCYLLATETGTNWLFDRYSYQATNSSVTTTTTQSYSLNTFRIVIPNGAVLSNLTIGYQIEKGSKKNSFTPYGTTPIELCKIGTYQDSIKKSTGKNLFDKGNVTDGGFYADHYISNASWCYFNTSSLKAGETYFTNQRAILSFYNGTTNISYVDKNNTSFIVPANTTNVYISTLITNKDTLQINEGSTALPYEPYGTGWYVKKEIGKVVLNGSEDWKNYTDVSGSSGTIAQILYQPNFNFKNRDGYSNLFQVIANYSATEHIVISGGLNGIFIQINKSRLSADNLSAFKTWLSTHNTTLYYVLATPAYTEITGELLSQLNALAKSYTSQTNISQESNDLASLLNATALKEME